MAKIFERRDSFIAVGKKRWWKLFLLSARLGKSKERSWFVLQTSVQQVVFDEKKIWPYVCIIRACMQQHHHERTEPNRTEHKTSNKNGLPTLWPISGTCSVLCLLFFFFFFNSKADRSSFPYTFRLFCERVYHWFYGAFGWIMRLPIGFFFISFVFSFSRSTHSKLRFFRQFSWKCGFQ